MKRILASFFLLVMLAGCASMTPAQKKGAWFIAGAVVTGLAISASGDGDAPSGPCRHAEYRTDVGQWVCISRVP